MLTTILAMIGNDAVGKAQNQCRTKAKAHCCKGAFTGGVSHQYSLPRGVTAPEPDLYGYYMSADYPLPEE
jgi:hypothetical protein